MTVEEAKEFNDLRHQNKCLKLQIADLEMYIDKTKEASNKYKIISREEAVMRTFTNDNSENIYVIDIYNQQVATVASQSISTLRANKKAIYIVIKEGDDS